MINLPYLLLLLSCYKNESRY